MHDSSSHDFYRRLVEASCREVEPQRVDVDRRIIMSLIAEVFGRKSCAALLWLTDYEITKEEQELRLAYVWYGENRTDIRPKELCNRKIVSIKNASNINMGWLTEWYRYIFPECEVPSTRWFQLNHGDDCIGYLQILSHASQDEIDNANSDPRLIAALRALTDKIAVGRKVRTNAAIQHLQQELARAKDDVNIWGVIARTTRTYISARLALIYRPVDVTEGRKLSVHAGNLDGAMLSREVRNALASTEDSVTWKIFAREGAIRVHDIHDDAYTRENFDAIPSSQLRDRLDKMLNPASAWMAASVVVPSVNNQKNGVLLIKIVNKKAKTYLQDNFSKTDVEIIEEISRYLATYLPGKSVAEAVSAITQPLQSLSKSGAGTEPVAEQLLDSLVRELAKHVQGVEAIAFQFPGLPTICSSRGRPFKDLVIKERQAESLQPWRSGQWLYVAMMGHEGRMLVLLQQNDLPAFQAEIIRRVGAEMIWLLHEITSYQSALQRIMEIRHAIHSGIQGILGNVKPALSKLKLLAKDHSAEILEREFVRGAQFRKGLEKALIAASHASKVLEEGRYAFVGVTYDSLRLGSHSLHAIVNEVMSVARIEAELRSITLEYIPDIPNDLDMVVCDRAAIIIVFQNMIENAIKYSFRNTTSYIRLYTVRGNWCFSVTDHGVYIDPSDYKIIFQPFKRVYTHDPAASQGGSRRPGTGLGLSICQRIVKAHYPQARITVQSRRDSLQEPAETTFTISIPRRLSRPPPPEE